MSPTLYSLLVIALTFIAFAFWAFRRGTNAHEAWQVISIIVPICIAIFGFGFFANVSTWKKTEEKCKVYEVIRGKHVTVVCTDKGNIVFENYATENISDSSNFFWDVNMNHYNCEIRRTLKY